MLRAGIPFLPISPRNSPAAIAHLVQSTHPTHFFVSVDVSMRSLAEESLALMEASLRPPIVRMPSYEDLYTSTEDQDFRRLPPRPRDPNMAATNIIVHSSGKVQKYTHLQSLITYLGSTSFPKPIRWTDRTCIQASMAPCMCGHDLVFFRRISFLIDHYSSRGTKLHGQGVWHALPGYVPCDRSQFLELDGMTFHATLVSSMLTFLWY